MGTHFPNMANGGGEPAVPPPIPVAWHYAHLIRRPGDPIVHQRFEFTELARVVREHLSNQIGTRSRDEAARQLWVQGRPGEGKSEGCLVSCLLAGFHVFVVSPGLFAGEVEGAPVEKLHSVLAEAERWSVAHNCRVVFVFDDLDLSTANVGDNQGHTINSELFINEIMSLADKRHLYRNVDGSNIGFIVTVNDATGMRESLNRPGRAILHEHVPTAEDKANIAWAILQPQTSAERDLVDALVRKHRHQPVAFWKALYFRMRALQAKDLIADRMPSKTEIDAAFGSRLVLTPDIAWTAAKQLRTSRVRSYLAKTHKKWWGR